MKIQGDVFVVDEGGFGPPKLKSNRFTVCPLWPLGNSSIFSSAFGADDRLSMKWSWWTDSNPRPADYKSAALPTELHQQTRVLPMAPNGRGDRTRTCGILVPNQALYQTELRPGSWSLRDSVTILPQPMAFVKGFYEKYKPQMPRICGLYIWRARRDSNPRPFDS